MFKPFLTGIELSTLCLHEFSSKSKTLQIAENHVFKHNIPKKSWAKVTPKILLWKFLDFKDYFKTKTKKKRARLL